MTDRLALYEHTHPGRFIAFCGMDGSGKTTLIDALSQELVAAGNTVVHTIQPSREARESPLFVRYMYDRENRHTVDYRAVMCLLTSDRLQQLHDTIVPALARGDVVITDRYVFTAVAQMRARLGGADESWFLDVLRYAPRPDLTLFLDPGFEVSQRRVGRRTGWRESYVEADHDQRLYLEYRRLVDDEGLDLVGSDRPPEATLADICRLVRDRHPHLLG